VVAYEEVEDEAAVDDGEHAPGHHVDLLHLNKRVRHEISTPRHRSIEPRPPQILSNIRLCAYEKTTKTAKSSLLRVALPNRPLACQSSLQIFFRPTDHHRCKLAVVLDRQMAELADNLSRNFREFRGSRALDNFLNIGGALTSRDL